MEAVSDVLSVHEEETEWQAKDAEELRQASDWGEIARKRVDQFYFQLTFDMMLGIRTTVMRAEREILGPGAADPAEFRKMERIAFPTEGSAHTPPHGMAPFYFKDYSPLTFRRIRARFNIDPAHYLNTICGGFQYLEFQTNSKSGEFFFFSYNREFLIKTISHNEALLLHRMLPDYYAHVMENPNTLLTRFYGLHKVKPQSSHFVYFLIMGSVFASDLPVHSVYDLKGSRVGRSASRKDKSSANCIFKDNDFIEQGVRLQVGAAKKAQLVAQFRKDVTFLQSYQVMDYSLLVGIHHCDRHDEQAKHTQIDSQRRFTNRAAESGFKGDCAFVCGPVKATDSATPSPVSPNGVLSGDENTSDEGSDTSDEESPKPRRTRRPSTDSLGGYNSSAPPSPTSTQNSLSALCESDAALLSNLALSSTSPACSCSSSSSSCSVSAAAAASFSPASSPTHSTAPPPPPPPTITPPSTTTATTIAIATTTTTTTIVTTTIATTATSQAALHHSQSHPAIDALPPRGANLECNPGLERSRSGGLDSANGSGKKLKSGSSSSSSGRGSASGASSNSGSTSGNSNSNSSSSSSSSSTSSSGGGSLSSSCSRSCSGVMEEKKKFAFSPPSSTKEPKGRGTRGLVSSSTVANLNDKRLRLHDSKVDVTSTMAIVNPKVDLRTAKGRTAALNVSDSTVLLSPTLSQPRNDGAIPSTQGPDCVYFIGIIDMLVNYGLRKKGETMMKSLRGHKKSELSSVEPVTYADRLVKFLDGICE